MTDARCRRLAAAIGLALAAAVALWWLGSTRLALDHGSETGRSAAEALQALWLVRAMAIAVLGPRVGVSRGWHPGMTESLALVAPAWPLVVLAWSASSASWPQLAGAELVLLAAGLALPLIGRVLRRALKRAALAELSASAAGIALATAAWALRGLWALPPF
jgi:hypothetical protein